MTNAESIRAALELSPPEGWADRLESLRAMLADANARTNLTRITDREDFFAKHVADSLLLVRVAEDVRTRALAVADIGCGGGFPGLPLALTFPALSVTEIDSAAKKVALVGEFAAALGLSSVRTLVGRARELARRDDLRERFDLVVARAVAETPALVKECRGFIAPGGRLIAYKTPGQADEEAPTLAREAAKAHLRLERRDLGEVPGVGARSFWVLHRDAPPPG